MKRLLLIFCALFALSTAWADTWTDPETGIKWTYKLLGDSKVSLGLGEISSPAVSKLTEGDIIIPSTLNGYPVTSIGRHAFRECTKLTSIEIPKGVTSIGSSAFSLCSSLTSVTIPEGVTSIGDYTFYFCSSLTSVTIPKGVTSIGGEAFDGCLNLTSVTIPEGVTEIGKEAFSDCSRLTSVTIPKGVTKIWWNTFYNCSSLTSVTIPEGVTEIGGKAFYNCSGLTSVTIPSSVTSIGDNAFSDVAPETLTAAWLPSGMSSTNLTTVIIPEGTTSIPSSAFAGCPNLSSVTVPESLTFIGSSAFEGCSSLTLIKFNGPPCSVGELAFSGVTATATYTGRYANRWEVQLDIGLWDGHDLTFTTANVSVEVTRVGAGEVTTSAADGIVEYFPKGETRSLTATANEGYIFMGWSGDVVSLEPTITLTSEDVKRYQLTALFLPKALIKAVAKEMAEDEKLTSDTDVETIISNKVTAGDLVSKAQAQTDVEGLISDKLKSGELVSRSDAKADAKTEANTVVDEKVVSKELVTKQQIKDLSMKTPVIDVTSGSGTLSLTLQKSTNLSDEEAWKDLEVTNPSVDANGNVTIDITPKEDEDTAFYKFVVKPEDQTK